MRSTFRSVRAQEGRLVRHLRQRHVLWLHGWAMGLLTLGAMALANAALRGAGVDTLAGRYVVALGVGYVTYLLIVRIWAGMLVRHEERDVLDAAQDVFRWPNGPGNGASFSSGRGGDFGGGGATGGWDGDGVAEGVDGASHALGDVASGAWDAAASADEAAIVVVPVVAVFLAAVAVLLGAGGLLLAYFGTEALLAAAVELAFAYTAARTVVRVEREGWLLAAVRLTWKPMLGALVCAALLGGLIDHFIPQADTLPQAVRLLRVR